MSIAPKIIVLPPGPKSREIIRRDADFASPSISNTYPLVVECARDYIIQDVDGNEFIDFNSGHGIINIGHSHPKVVEAIKEQVGKIIYYPMDMSYSDSGIKLYKKLSDITPISSEKRIFYSNSREEAIEAGIKTAMWYKRNHRIIAFIGAYHGSTLGAISLAAVKTVQVKYFPTILDVTHVPYAYCYRCPFKQSFPNCHYWCIDYIEELLSKRIPPEEVTAIIFEPIQDSSGCIVPPPDYFKRLKRISEKYGFLLIDDETQTSIGRSGRWFAIENWGTKPEILCLNGTLSSGLPLGVTITESDIMDWEPEAHIAGLGGNAVACAAALSVIDVVRSEHLLENAAIQGNYLIRRLRELGEKYPIIGDVRGKGLMIGFEVVKDLSTREPAIAEARQIVQKSFRRGILLDMCGRSVVKITPPLTVTQNILDSGLEIIESVISEVVAEK